MTRLALAKALLGLTATFMVLANLLGCSGDAGVTIPPPPLGDAGPQLDARPDADPPDATPSQTAATPEFNPAPGTFSAPQSITLRTDTAGASIHYTLDGSTPDATSPVYSLPISVAKTTTIKAIARKASFDDSAVRSGTYVIDIPPGVVQPVQFEPNAGDYSNDVEVHLTSATADATFCYTLDGSDPACNAEVRCTGRSEPTTGTVIVSKSGQRLRAMACKKGMIASATTQADYTLTSAAPAFDPMPGSYDPHNPRAIALTSATRGGVIHYSINGSTPPSCSSPDIVPENGAIPVLTGDAVIQALTCKENYATSSVVSASYLGTKCTGSFYITTRAGLEELARCEEISGDLTISGSGGGSDVTDLAPLSHLRRVGGDLGVLSNNALTSLHGLEALAVVGGAMEVKGNEALTRLDALVALQSVGGRLSVWDNHAVIEWVGPSTLTKVGGLSILGQRSLQRVGGFSQLKEIGGEFLVGGNDALTAFDDMPALTTVTGEVSFSSNAALERLSGFAGVHDLGNLNIQSNPALTQFLAFSQVTKIGGQLLVTNNPKLAQLDFKKVATVHVLHLADLPALRSLHDLAGLTKVEGLVTITGTVGFANLTGLEQLTTIKETLSINSTKGLVDLTGLSNLAAVEVGWLSVWGNADLTSLRGLDHLRALGSGITLSENPALTEVGGLNALESGVEALHIKSNPKLTRLNGLNRLPSTVSLLITDNVALEKLAGFESLKEIRGIVDIKRCSALQDLSGLEALEKIGAHLDISSNDALTRLDALARFTSLGGHLTITFNASLPPCQADRVFDRLRAHGYVGLPDIRNNGGTGTCD